MSGRDPKTGADDGVRLDAVERLNRVLLMADDLCHSPGAGSSSRLERWETLRNTARYLKVLLRHGGLEAYLDLWLPRVSAELQEDLLEAYDPPTMQ